MRHYLHGDPHETDDGLYFCHRCDIFALPRHFDNCQLGMVVKRGTEYRETHAWRYVKYWQLLSGKKGVVEDRRNLFWDGALSDRKLPHLERA